ncbi:DNA-processing protein DprA [Cytobacillus sp. Hm23]
MLQFKDIEELKAFLSKEILLTNEAREYLGISSQRLHQLIQSGKITPIKTTKSSSLFLKPELYERKFEIEKSYGAGRSVANDEGGVNSTETINDAINYFTLLALFKGKNKKCDPIYHHLISQADLTLPTSEVVEEISEITGFEEREILLESYKVKKGFEKLEKDDFIVKVGTELYPSLLAKTDQAPVFLFMRGNPNLLKFNAISIVGTRNPSESGEIRANVLAEKFGANRIVVASGLAKGIDTAAHNGAIRLGNPTIAVIGTPLTKVYPKENKELQKEIEENNLVISQFAPSMNVQRWNFPMRNAVMSGISLATVIIEAGETSGSLIQADYALKQGRMVFIPQSAIDNDELKWPKKFIQRKGAYKFSKIEELLVILADNHSELLPGFKEEKHAPANITEGSIDIVHKE